MGRHARKKDFRGGGRDRDLSFDEGVLEELARLRRENEELRADRDRAYGFIQEIKKQGLLRRNHVKLLLERGGEFGPGLHALSLIHAADEMTRMHEDAMKRRRS